jgi:MerR family transcriptional regulator, light-induced transcriptional regulator
MAEPNHLGGAADTPVYTIKTVVQQTGITPATLRAWERRYGVLSPGRSDGGYRLYSERDIAVLRWLKAQVEGGVAISSAVALLEMQHRAGEQPEQEILSASSAGRQPAAGPRNAPAVVGELLEALLAFREAEAEAILAEVFALYPVESVAEDIIAPVLVEIGERWHRGEASIVQEHFATAFLRRRLSTLLHVYGQPAAGPLAITGSAPGEWHDVGILLVSLTLRRHGWRVIHLGQNVPVSHLIREVESLAPDLICFSATTADSIGGLVELSAAIDALPDPKPRLILGGRVLNTQGELRALFPHAYISASARDLITFLA